MIDKLDLFKNTKHSTNTHLKQQKNKRWMPLHEIDKQIKKYYEVIWEGLLT